MNNGWTFGAFVGGGAPAFGLMGLMAATGLTGIFDNNNTPDNTPSVTPPPPFGTGKSTMIQLWELALNNENTPKQ